MPEMPIDTREMIVASSDGCIGCTTSSCTFTTTDSASAVSPCAHDDSHGSNAYLRRRILTNFLKNVKEAPVVGAAYTYVRDVKERSPLVKVVSNSVQPFLEKSVPIVFSVVDRIDNSIEATANLIADESSDVMNEFATKKSRVSNCLNDSYESAKNRISSHATNIYASGNDMIVDVKKLREGLYAALARFRKEGVVEELHNILRSSKVQTVLGLPSTTCHYILTVMNQNIDLCQRQFHILLSSFNNYQIEFFMMLHHLNNLCVHNGKNLLQHYQQRVVSVAHHILEYVLEKKEKIQIFCLHSISQLDYQAYYQQFFHTMQIFRAELKVKSIQTYKDAELFIGKMIDAALQILLRIPEDNRKIAEQIYIKLCSTFKQRFGEDETNKMMSYIFDSAIVSWVRHLSASASSSTS